jgi:hypothetical protein
MEIQGNAIAQSWALHQQENVSIPAELDTLKAKLKQLRADVSASFKRAGLQFEAPPVCATPENDRVTKASPTYARIKPARSGLIPGREWKCIGPADTGQGHQMTEHQEEEVKKAQKAFVAALAAGIEEDVLIDAVFDASTEWLVASLKACERKQAEACQERYSVSK